MGRDKAGLTINGEPVLTRLLRRLAWTAGPTLLVTAPGRDPPTGAEGFDVQACDTVAGEGPLRGLLTACEHATTAEAVVVPVDMPEITTAVLLWLARTRRERRAAALMSTEPLPMALHLPTAAPMIRARLAAGGSLRSLARCDSAAVVARPPEWPAALWTNLNRPEDLIQYVSGAD